MRVVIEYRQTDEDRALQVAGPRRYKRLNWEGIRWQLFNEGNPHRSPDGRTYTHFQDGKYHSNFVSQHAKIIYDNIEEGVLDLVQALHAKGYWTFGSCQSHALAEPRWVGVVFTTENRREAFIESLRASGLPLAFEREVLPHDKRYGKERGITFLLGNEERPMSDYTRFWEIMFRVRVSDRFYPVAVKVCATDSRNLLTQLWYRYVWKRFFLNRVTARLTRYVEKRLKKAR